ncbi:MAG: glycosyltransferase family 2 protein [Anaerolineae bacterium]|nr:glycosyltransferase family 2 protein [Anaerolineae bacterium]MDW8173202.1 glycosyltransferase family 2 protein [Anaerolineae bacterium]
MIDVSIIIVSWNVADMLLDCLESIEAAQTRHPAISLEVIVVDSASQDDTVARVRQRFPQVRLLSQTENVGFTRGSNLGLAQARGRALFLLNPDTLIIGEAISLMLAHLDTHPQVGIVGPHTLNGDGSTQSSRRCFPTRRIAFFESTWLQSLAPQRWLDDYTLAQADDRATLDVDWVQGSALMLRRAVYEQIGGLDEAYVMYYEELDFCKRAKDAGWRVVYLGQAQIIHHGGASSEQSGAWKHIHFQRSKLRYFRKTYGPSFAALLRSFLLMSYGAQLLLEALKGLLGHKRALRRQRVDVYLQVLRDGLLVT